MTGDFHESYTEQEVAPPPERSTGFVFAAVAAIVGFFLRDSAVALAVCALLSAGFAGVSLVRPALLGPLNRAWFRLSLLLGRIVNPVVLGLMFAVAIVPFGLVMRLWRDPLRRKPGAQSTYWIARPPRASETHSMTNQF